jgi:cytochrome c-type biogenesis protein CcmH/NrfF
LAVSVLLAAPAIVFAARCHPSLPQIEREVMCPVCGVPLNLAGSPQADRERAYIRALIAQGRCEAQIKRALVDQFGSSVLALPPQRGVNLWAYLVPLGLFAGLVGGLAVLLLHWRRRTSPGEPTPVAPALTQAESRRVDRELARFDR